MTMQDQLKLLEDHVCHLASDPNFIHHEWFVEHHLKIVEVMANELCDLYPQACRDSILAMVWLHDLGKILTNKNVPREQESEIMVAESRKLLEKLNFTGDFIEKVLRDLTLFEQSSTIDLSRENIEIQIAVTADGGSHFVGPFMSIHWYECPYKGIPGLIEADEKKALKDWHHKIILPEARQAFEARFKQIMQQDKPYFTKAEK